MRRPGHYRDQGNAAILKGHDYYAWVQRRIMTLYDNDIVSLYCYYYCFRSTNTTTPYEIVCYGSSLNTELLSRSIEACTLLSVY